jgi:P4 family phage/plasmid primase-like protien
MAEPERGPRGTWQHLCWWRNGALDLTATLAGLPANDREAALLIAAEREGELHYVDADSQWRIWDGTCHALDDSRKAGRIIIGLSQRAEQALAACRQEIASALTLRAGPEPDRTALSKAITDAWEPWLPGAKYLAGLSRSAGSGALLKYMTDIFGTSPDTFAEKHPYWLNVANGTIDLQTGLIYRHDPAHMLAYCLPVPYHHDAKCPRFLQLLWSVSGYDREVFEYLIRVLGYCLIGANPEQLIFFISGPSASGKSVLLQVAGDVLGDLAHNGQAALITIQRHGRNARTENSIRGRRLVTITETSAFMTIDEGQLKRITGEAIISVDQHYAKTEIKTPVTFTIVGATNQMAVLTDFDDAMQRRVVVIPGGMTVPYELRDPKLAERILESEREGILALLVKAAAEYCRTGRLDAPMAVQIKTAQYRAEQNTVANFLADCTHMCPGGMTAGGVPAQIPMAEAWRVYEKYCRGSSRLGRNEFHDHMKRQPGIVWNETSRRYENLVWNMESVAAWMES